MKIRKMIEPSVCCEYISNVVEYAAGIKKLEKAAKQLKRSVINQSAVLVCKCLCTKDGNGDVTAVSCIQQCAH